MILSTIISGYREFKYSWIDDVAGVSADFIKEDEFLDDGYLVYMENKLLDELDNSDKEEKSSIKNQLGFYLSNNPQRLEEAIDYLEDSESALKKCIEAMEEYYAGDTENAFELLSQNYDEVKQVEQHYLINKIYGLLLVKEKDYSEAVECLCRALKLRPGDMECYYALEESYANDYRESERKQIRKIIELLSKNSFRNR